MVEQEAGSEFSERELSSVAWAVGKLEVQVGLLLIEVRRECEKRKLKGFNWHDISNLAWAHAVAVERGAGWETFFDLLVQHALRKPLDGCVPQALANLAWALSTLGVSAAALLERLATHAEKVIGLAQFKPQEISALSWAVAAGGNGCTGFFDSVEDLVVSRELEGYNPQKMASLVCAFAQTGHRADRLFDMVEEAIIERAMVGFTCLFFLYSLFFCACFFVASRGFSCCNR
jgi:hypothetical protein